MDILRKWLPWFSIRTCLPNFDSSEIITASKNAISADYVCGSKEASAQHPGPARRGPLDMAQGKR